MIMLTILKLKKLIENLPDEAYVNAYEGESCGLQVSFNGKEGWIETGFGDDECNDKKHNLNDIEIKLKKEPE
jgi:hypothetical protein